MKPPILAIMMAVLILISCQKKDTDPLVSEPEVSFSASLISPDGGLKSDNEWECKDLSVDYAQVLIDNVYYYPEVFELGGTYYTQAIKMDIPTGTSKTFTVSEFLLLHINGTRDDVPYPMGDDEIVWATPTEDSQYKVYVTDPVDLNFELEPFHKAEVPVDVLCYQENLMDKFGFNWYSIHEIIVIEQCFFGDICLENPELWEESLYGSQQNGPQIDVPAIFYIEVSKDGIPLPGSPFGNAAWFGEGAPLCVQYPDDQGIDGEEFTLELYILVLQNGDFVYVKYFEWIVVDDQLIPTGGDGIVDFVIGDCNYLPPDLYIPPLDNVPPQDPVCETGYAYGGTYAECFIDHGFNRWGWTNGALPEGTYEFPIYAAAGQCNPSNGTMIGDLDVVYSDGTVTMTYNITHPELRMYAVHSYAGNGMFPLKNGNPTVAPGQYPQVNELPEGELVYTHTFTGVSGPVFVIAHCVACGDY